MKRSEGIAFLLKDGNLDVPCSRYGRDTAECAEVAWRLTYLYSKEIGEPITKESLEQSMSSVVNEHPDVAYIIRTYGGRKYR